MNEDIDISEIMSKLAEAMNTIARLDLEVKSLQLGSGSFALPFKPARKFLSLRHLRLEHRSRCITSTDSGNCTIQTGRSRIQDLSRQR